VPIYEFGEPPSSSSDFLQAVTYSSGFVLNGTSKPVLSLAVGDSYTFNQDSVSNSGHPMCFGTTPEDVNTAITSSLGVSYYLDGTIQPNYSSYASGFASATTRRIIIEPNTSTPVNYYYFCENDSGEGNQVRTITKLSQATYNFNIIPDAIYGSGKDGTITISSNINLERDMYYSNLTISPGVHVNTNGYRVFVRNILTFSSLQSNQATTTIGIRNGFSGTGTLMGGFEGNAVNSLGGDGINHVASLPTVQSGGPEYYDLPENAINSYSLHGGQQTPLPLRGGAGNGSAPGGGVVVISARKVVGYGTMYADGYYDVGNARYETGGGVIILCSQFVRPSSVLVNVNGHEQGTVKELLV
jgi:hypothetical protein